MAGYEQKETLILTAVFLPCGDAGCSRWQPQAWSHCVVQSCSLASRLSQQLCLFCELQLILTAKYLLAINPSKRESIVWRGRHLVNGCTGFSSSDLTAFSSCIHNMGFERVQSPLLFLFFFWLNIYYFSGAVCPQRKLKRKSLMYLLCINKHLTPAPFNLKWPFFMFTIRPSPTLLL